MSYILDTLKKIEKEKSESDNKLDLKKLILQDTSEANRIKMLRKRSHILTFLILAISIFFFLNFSVFKFSFPLSNLPLDSQELKGENISKQTQSSPVKHPVDNLPSYSETSNQGKTPREIERVSESKNRISRAANLSGEQGKSPELLPKKSATQKEANESTGTSLLSYDLSDDDIGKSLDNIEQQIKEENKKNRLAHNVSSRIISRGAIPRDIADIKISGIVFFGDGAAALNYAIASYKGENQIKLKEGDWLDDIEVLKIESEKILLIFKNKIFERKLGG